MTTIIKPIGKVGKGGAKMVKAGLKAAKKGAGVASAHSAVGATPPTLLPTTGDVSGAVRPSSNRGGRGGLTLASGASVTWASGSDDDGEDNVDVWKKKLNKELISPEEEKLLEALLLKEDVFAGDTATEELVNNLTKQVQALDAANVYALLSSGPAMQDLTRGIDEADAQLDELHTWLSYYDNQLTNIQKYIKKIEENNNEMEVLTRNQHSLLEELDSLLTTYSLDESTTSLLTFGELEVGPKLEAVVAAGERWEARYKAAALLRESSPEIARMTASQRQMAEFERFRDVFAARLERFLSELFFSLKGDSAEEKTQVPDHKTIFRKLEAYKELMHWLQRNKFASYLHLAQTYADCMQRLYDEEQRVFFAEMRRVIPKEPRDNAKFGGGVAAPQPGKRDSINMKGLKKGKKMEKVLRQGLRDWILVTAREQIFSEEMFAFPPSRDPPFSPSLIDCDEAEADSSLQQKLRAGVRAMGGGISLESMLAQAFGAGLGAWAGVFGGVTRYDHLATLALVVEMEIQINKYQKDSEPLVRLLTRELLLPATRMFTHSIDEDAASIGLLQPSIKAAGILPPIVKYPQFVEDVEVRLEGSVLGRRLGDRALVRIYSSLAHWIDSLGEDDPKHRYILRAENYRYLYAELWPEAKKGPRTECLKEHLEQALRQADDSLRDFIH